MDSQHGINVKTILSLLLDDINKSPQVKQQKANCQDWQCASRAGKLASLKSLLLLAPSVLRVPPVVTKTRAVRTGRLRRGCGLSICLFCDGHLHMKAAATTAEKKEDWQESHWRHHYWEHEKWQVHQCCSIYCQSDGAVHSLTSWCLPLFPFQPSSHWSTLHWLGIVSRGIASSSSRRCSTRWFAADRAEKVLQRQLGSDAVLGCSSGRQQQGQAAAHQPSLTPYLFSTSAPPPPPSALPPCASCRW